MSAEHAGQAESEPEPAAEASAADAPPAEADDTDAEAARPSRWERRAKGKSEQSFGKVPVRGNVQSTPHRRDYASRRRSGG